MNQKITCSECKREIKDGHSFLVDDQPVCYECLFGQVEPVMIYPIGKVSLATDVWQRSNRHQLWPVC